jgi:hypothetical protein
LPALYCIFETNRSGGEFDGLPYLVPRWSPDYDQHGIGDLQNFVGRTLRLTTGICASVWRSG